MLMLQCPGCTFKFVHPVGKRGVVCPACGLCGVLEKDGKTVNTAPSNTLAATGVVRGPDGRVIHG